MDKQSLDVETEVENTVEGQENESNKAAYQEEDEVGKTNPRGNENGKLMITNQS